MQYYKNYRIIQNIDLAEGINHIINFFHKLPIIRNMTKDKYKCYGLKNFVFTLGPIFSILSQIVKSFITLAVLMWPTGALIWATNIPWQLGDGFTDGFYDLSLASLAFLSFYITGAVLSSALTDSKDKIRELNSFLKMDPKNSGISIAVFDPLRVAIGRSIAFAFVLGIKNGFLISFILLFIKLIANSINLRLYKKIGKNLGDNLLIILLIFLLSFFLLKNASITSTTSLLIIAIIGLVASVFSIKYLFTYQGYGEILEIARRESSNISMDFEQISNDSLALKNEDIDYKTKAKGTGYEFLNDLFFKRHKRLIVKPILKRSVIVFVIMVLGLIFLKYKCIDLSWNINKYITIAMAELIFILYNNESTSRAMFLNCDRPLMRYGFYKNKPAIFDMYKYRYISFLKLNSLGLLLGLLTFVIGFFLFTEIALEKLVTYISFIIVSYFFYPAWNLGNYYLFQPYNEEARSLGVAYKWVGLILSYINILFIPLFVIKEVADGLVILEILAVVMVVITILYPLLVRVFGDKTFRIIQ